LYELFEDHLFLFKEEFEKYEEAFQNAALEIYDDSPYPIEYLPVFRGLWKDSGIQRVVKRGNEAAIPDK